MLLYGKRLRFGEYAACVKRQYDSNQGSLQQRPGTRDAELAVGLALLADARALRS
jgi:hypothetical protein